MFKFGIEYFFKQKNKNLNLIAIITSVLVLFSIVLSMFYDQKLTPPLDFSSWTNFLISLFRMSIIFLLLAAFVYFIIYSCNYYNKINSQILGLLKIFGHTTGEIVFFFMIQILMVLIISFVLFMIISLVTIPVLFKWIYVYLKQQLYFSYSLDAYYNTFAFLFLILLIMIFNELMYIIQTPTTHLLKNDEIISFKFKKKKKFKQGLYILLFCYGIYIIIVEPLDIYHIVPIDICILGINGIVKYVIPEYISLYLKKHEVKGEMIVTLKNYLLTIKQINVLMILDVVCNLTLMLLIWFFLDNKGAFVGYLAINIMVNIIIHYCLYYRLKVRSSSQTGMYKKLYVLGYDKESLKEYYHKEVNLVYFTLLLILSIYIITLSICTIINQNISILYLSLLLTYLIPLFISYIAIYIKEGGNLEQWKKS